MATPFKARRADVDYSSIIYNPQTLSTLYTTFARKMMGGAGITWGIPSVDRLVIPMHPGDVVGILGRPGHGKSSVAAYLAKREGLRLAREGLAQKFASVVVGTEQSVEEMEAFYQSGTDFSVTDLAWGRVPEEKILARAQERLNLPVWMIGESVTQPHSTPLRLTVPNIYGALMEMGEEYGISPSLIVIDYIQLVAVEGKEDRVSQVSEAIYKAKELARALRCPIVLCVQAGRSVDRYESDHLPTIADAQWASAIEQVCDKIFAVWRPVLTNKEMTKPKNPLELPRLKPISINGTPYEITQRLFIMRLLKQRLAQAGFTFPLDFTPQYIQLADLELRAQEEVLQDE